MVAPGYLATPDDDNPSAYQPGGRRRPLPLLARYNLAPTKRGTRSRAARYAIHKKKQAKRRRYTQMPLTYSGDSVPAWWHAGKVRLREAGWEVDELYAGSPDAPGRAKPLRMPRCRRPGGAWYYPESAKDVEWLIASTRVREARG